MRHLLSDHEKKLLALGKGETQTSARGLPVNASWLFQSDLKQKVRTKMKKSETVQGDAFFILFLVFI